MRRFGSRVTVIDRNSRLIHREDEDISEAMHELFKDEGIDVVTSTRITRVEGRSGESVKLSGDLRGSAIVLEGSHILVAAGRTPNTDGIGLELAGVETTANGYIKVNERLETTASDVGQRVNVPEAHTSLISRKMIFRLSPRISRAVIA